MFGLGAPALTAMPTPVLAISTGRKLTVFDEGIDVWRAHDSKIESLIGVDALFDVRTACPIGITVLPETAA